MEAQCDSFFSSFFLRTTAFTSQDQVRVSLNPVSFLFCFFQNCHQLTSLPVKFTAAGCRGGNGQRELVMFYGNKRTAGGAVVVRLHWRGEERRVGGV